MSRLRFDDTPRIRISDPSWEVAYVGVRVGDLRQRSVDHSHLICCCKQFILAGDKTARKRFIEAVAFPWFDVIAFLAKDPQCRLSNSQRQMGNNSGAYKQAGFEEVVP